MPVAATGANVRPTGISWLDRLMSDPQMAVPGPAAMTGPLRYIPMGPESPAPNWLGSTIRSILRGSVRDMPGQPRIGVPGPSVKPGGFVGASVDPKAGPQLLTPLDRIRAHGPITEAPLHMQSGAGKTLPSPQLMDFMEMLRQAIETSSIQ